MKRLFAVLVVAACLAAFVAPPAPSQRPTPGRVQRELEANRSRTADQRVARQVEVIRLEKMIERLEARILRLERQQLATSQFPAITVTEAEAALNFAEAELERSKALNQRDVATEADVAADQLAVIQARAQRQIAQAAQDDRIASLKVELTYAEQRVAEETQKQQQLEQLVARGYGSADGLKLQRLAVDVAKQELVRAKSRLAAQRELGGEDAGER